MEHLPHRRTVKDSVGALVNRSDSSLSTTVRSSSFTDPSVDARVAASMIPGDSSAALMATSTMTPHPTKPAQILRTAPTSLHRGDTLERGMDALAGQDTSVPPESASVVQARARRSSDQDP